MNAKLSVAAAAALAASVLAASAARADGLVEPQAESLTAQAAQMPSQTASPSAATPSKGGAISLSASLVDQEGKARQHAATVSVKVKGLQIVDPASVNEKPKAGQGHLHYKVDDSPVIATTATKLSFHDLKSGQHSITVILAGNDHMPLGPSETLTLTVP